MPQLLPMPQNPNPKLLSRKPIPVVLVSTFQLFVTGDVSLTLTVKMLIPTGVA
jgi:hypothetical protein